MILERLRPILIIPTIILLVGSGVQSGYSQSIVESSMVVIQRNLEEIDLGVKSVKECYNKLVEETGLSSDEIVFLFEKAGEKNVPADLVLGLFEVESDFDPKSVNKRTGVVGLGQLMPSTAKWIANMHDLPYSYDLLFDPYYNTELTFLYLSYLYDRYEDWDLALSSYRGYKKLGSNNYTRLVQSKADKYSKMLGEI